MSVVIEKSHPDSAALAADILRRGGIAVLPTDTVYGFSGIATNDESDTAALIRAVKGRAENKPFIKLISRPDDITRYTPVTLPEKLRAYWPGSLTIAVPDFSGNTEAFRCPGDAWLRRVIAACGFPLYSTSVNKSGEPILDTAADIQKIFGGSVDVLVVDGDKKNAVPSTIVAYTAERGTEIIRQGSVQVTL